HGARGMRPRNAEPLLVNLQNSWDNRPAAVTKFENLFISGDFVQTYTDFASMEAANEAARRAVNALVFATKHTSKYGTLTWEERRERELHGPCEVQDLKTASGLRGWNVFVKVMQAIDRPRYAMRMAPSAHMLVVAAKGFNRAMRVKREVRQKLAHEKPPAEAAAPVLPDHDWIEL